MRARPNFRFVVLSVALLAAVIAGTACKKKPAAPAGPNAVQTRRPYTPVPPPPTRTLKPGEPTPLPRLPE